VAHVANGCISEALRHMVLSGIQIDILDNRVINEGDEVDKLLATHFLIKQSQVGKTVSAGSSTRSKFQF